MKNITIHPLAAAIVAAACGSAHAASPDYRVELQVSVASPNYSATAAYNYGCDSGNLCGPQSHTAGGGGGTHGDSKATADGDASGLGTSAAVNALAYGYGGQYEQNGLMTTTNAAHADLARGSIGIGGANNASGAFLSSGEETGHAYMADLVTFTAAGASASTVTTIGLRVDISGQMLDPATSNAEAYFSTGFKLGDAQAHVQVESNDSYGHVPTIVAGQTTVNGAFNAGSAWTTATPGAMSFAGTLSFTGASVTLPFWIDMEQSCGSGMTCNYGDARVSLFNLGPGVSYTSGSGVFLTTPVPEPSSAALMLGGLAATGWLVRRRKSV